jgi:hypothetical protein
MSNTENTEFSTALVTIDSLDLEHVNGGVDLTQAHQEGERGAVAGAAGGATVGGSFGATAAAIATRGNARAINAGARLGAKVGGWAGAGVGYLWGAGQDIYRQATGG